MPIAEITHQIPGQFKTLQQNNHRPQLLREPLRIVSELLRKDSLLMGMLNISLNVNISSVNSEILINIDVQRNCFAVEF